MALDIRDAKSGFRHNEVVVFINEEVIRCGGSPAFYLTFHSRPWKDIEEALNSVVVDTQVPHAFKKACAWSALALGVRVAVRQREKQVRRIRQLQDQVAKREVAIWTLAMDLQRLSEERNEVVSKLNSARHNLKQVLNEHDMLEKKLMEFELSRKILAEWQDAGQPSAMKCPLAIEEQSETNKTGFQSKRHAVLKRKTPVAFTTGVAKPLSPEA
uniref:testis-expressed protein 13D-like n=1 Tax=Jaculus jaculus TaxID=51337 RepID=UPI001E1B5A3B|nr:testis-expressed protein 13D-like [Jaculus jaculus]